MWYYLINVLHLMFGSLYEYFNQNSLGMNLVIKPSKTQDKVLKHWMVDWVFCYVKKLLQWKLWCLIKCFICCGSKKLLSNVCGMKNGLRGCTMCKYFLYLNTLCSPDRTYKRAVCCTTISKLPLFHSSEIVFRIKRVKCTHRDLFICFH